MDKEVLNERDFFVVLNDIRAAKITGSKRDTITVFYQGGESVYFHVGNSENATEILGRIGRGVADLKHEGFVSVPSSVSSKKFNRDW